MFYYWLAPVLTGSEWHRNQARRGLMLPPTVKSAQGRALYSTGHCLAEAGTERHTLEYISVLVGLGTNYCITYRYCAETST